MVMFIHPTFTRKGYEGQNYGKGESPNIGTQSTQLPYEGDMRL